MERKVAVFANVVFEQYGNQSVRNFVEGLLRNHCRVTLLTTHQHESAYMRQFAARYTNLSVAYLMAMAGTVQMKSAPKSGLLKLVKEFIKRTFTYRQYSSNSQVIQWLSLLNTRSTLQHVVAYIKNNHAMLNDYERYIFLDVFGGMLCKYIKRVYPEFWARIAHKTVGYYLGTIMKQFDGHRLPALVVFPLSFWGSYKPLQARLIMTDDGTDGENVFRGMMAYHGPILFIRNGIDDRLAAHKVQPKVYTSTQLRFVTSSRLTGWKRIDRAIRFIYFVKQMAGDPVHLVIIGDGEERSALEALVQSLNINSDVTFTGALEYNNALQRIAENDFYIIFNDLSNMGNQINESIMLGLIPLTIDDGSTDSLLVNNFNALKFPMQANFEQNAACIFISNMNAGRMPMLSQNVCDTRKRVFTWRERNCLEYNFIFREESKSCQASRL